LIHLFAAALICSLGLWSSYSGAAETNAEARAFHVPISSLKTDTKSLFYRGLPLNADNPSMKYQDGQEAMAIGKKFPDALSCLSFEAEDETASLAKLNTGKFEKTADLEICLQRVANELGNLSKVEPWLRAIGFGSVEEGSISNLLVAKRQGLSSEKVAIFIANWRGGNFLKELLYPMSAKYNLAHVFLSFGFYPRNMYLTLAICRHDMRVISVDVGMIFL